MTWAQWSTGFYDGTLDQDLGAFINTYCVLVIGMKVCQAILL